MKKKSAIMLIIVLLFVFTIFMVISKIMSDIERNMDELSSMEILDVDIAKIPDGLYTGKYKVFPIDVEVVATVTDHRIIQIDLIKHTNGQGSPAEVIPERVIEAQSLKVDIVTGATYSSKVILKALENALLNTCK